MTGFFSLLLWFGSFLCFFGYYIQEDKADDKSNLYLGIVLATVVFVTGVFSYLQTSKAASLMDDFKGFIPRTAEVTRDGKKQSVPSEGIAVGDLIHLKAGIQIPADVVLLNASEMKVNNASLTGESDDLLRVVDGQGSPSPNIFEANNVAFFGTMCTMGVGEGIVIKTGDNTVIGLIAGLSQAAEAVETPLSIEIERFIKFISAVAIALGTIFFCFAVYMDYDTVTSLVFAIGIIVANVPEGLLATVTVSLALTAQRMAKKNVLVKNLESVETLGSTSCICSDKTGTLTQNKMTTSMMFIDRQVLDCSVNYQVYKTEVAECRGNPDKIKQVKAPQYPLEADAEKQIDEDNIIGFRMMCETIALSTVSYFSYTPDIGLAKQEYARTIGMSAKSLTPPEKWDASATKAERQGVEAAIVELKKKESLRPFNDQAVKGDASETGLIKFVEPLFNDKINGAKLWPKEGIDAFRKEHPVLADTTQDPAEQYKIDFSSDIKFNLLVRNMNLQEANPTDLEDNVCVFLKGAPDKVITRCDKYMINGLPYALTPEIYKEVMDANELFGNMGERVLGFSRQLLDPKMFKKDAFYDTKGWKNWREVKDFNADIPGWFPMWNLEFVGLVSLNDPPRKGVDMSVLKCRSAGIKVIMVTGDQKNTGAAIAAKVNIITDKEQEFNHLMKANPGWTEEQGMAESKAIVVHGDELAVVNFEEEGYDEQEIEKGRKVMDWIRIPEVVFARTTPSQKLLIVDACQRLGHVVAVTGDGVNDSPAIKKADIGVAMGCGSEVAQNAGDMILLDDNFSSIVNGVEEGRLIFDNLKKSIAYTLSSNIPEISPFLLFIVCQIPLPLSTVLILCIDLGTDMVPAISFAYENPELDIMERYPRNSKRDHLVNSKLICFAYLQIGIVQASAGFFTYFYMLNDYGIRPGGTFGLATIEGYIPKPSDIYNPDALNQGNSNYLNPDYKVMLNWNQNKHNAVDIRLFYAEKRGPASWTKCRWPNSENTAHPKFYNFSHVNNAQVCYTTEALRYAQCGYLVSIVCVQWADLMICKTRALSISQQGMINMHANFGLFFETSLVAFLCYGWFLNQALGTRQIAFPHFAVPSFSFFCVIMAYDELRKIFLRSGMVKSRRGRTKYIGWVARNTYY